MVYFTCAASMVLTFCSAFSHNSNMFANIPHFSFPIIPLCLPPVPQIISNWVISFGSANKIITISALHFAARKSGLKSSSFDFQHITPSTLLPPYSFSVLNTLQRGGKNTLQTSGFCQTRKINGVKMHVHSLTMKDSVCLSVFLSLPFFYKRSIKACLSISTCCKQSIFIGLIKYLNIF